MQVFPEEEEERKE